MLIGLVTKVNGINATPSRDVLFNLSRVASLLRKAETILRQPVFPLIGYVQPDLLELIPGMDEAFCDGRAVEFSCDEYGCPRDVINALAAAKLQGFDLLRNVDHEAIRLVLPALGDTPRHKIDRLTV